jgi:RNA polymerase sigma-70 factor, ECF subfamily
MALTYQQFQTLALAELASVNRVARALTRSVVEADDLTQETFLKAIRSWSSFELRDAGIRPWLMTILNRTHLNRIRQSSRQSAYIDHADVDDVAATPPTITNGSDGTVDWSQFDGHLLAALAELPENLRTTLVLWAMQDLSYKEIAETMGVPIGTVMSRLHRARGLMHKLLSDREKDPKSVS